MTFSSHSRSEIRYIAGVFAKAGLVTAAWFILAGGVLNVVSGRVSIHCDRDEESLALCQVTSKYLISESSVNIPAGELQQVTSQAVPYHDRMPYLAKWEMKLNTDHGSYNFTSHGEIDRNPWGDLGDRTNQFLDSPQQRTFEIASDYGFWYKLLNPAIAGISTIVGIFLVPCLLITLKQGVGGDLVIAEHVEDFEDEPMHDRDRQEELRIKN
jgi:hypothetical protein